MMDRKRRTVRSSPGYSGAKPASTQRKPARHSHYVARTDFMRCAFPAVHAFRGHQTQRFTSCVPICSSAGSYLRTYCSAVLAHCGWQACKASSSSIVFLQLCSFQSTRLLVCCSRPIRPNLLFLELRRPSTFHAISGASAIERGRQKHPPALFSTSIPNLQPWIQA